MSGPMPPAQSGAQRGLFGIPHGADYNPRLDPFAGGGGQWRSGMGHGQANVPLPVPRPGGLGRPGVGGRPAPTYTGQTQQIPAQMPAKSQAQMPQTPVQPQAKPPVVAPTPAPAPRPGPVPMPRARPAAPPPAARPPAAPPAPPTRGGGSGGGVPQPVPPVTSVPPQGNPMAAALLQAIANRDAAGGTPVLGGEAPVEVASKGNRSQAPPGRGGIGSDAAAAARASGATTAETPGGLQRSNVQGKEERRDIKQVDPNIEAMAKYEQQKKDLIAAILATTPKRINYNAKQIGPTAYTPLPPPTIPRSGPNAGMIKPGVPAKVDRSHKDSSMAFYTALGVQPGDKAGANKAIAALVKQREIAPSSITPAQDRILASIGKSDAFNLSIEPKEMFKRLMPSRPERMEIPERKKGPMDTQLEIRPEFQNRTDAWRPGIVTPFAPGTEPPNDQAEKVVKKFIDRLGDPPKEGTEAAPTQKDVDQQSKFDKARKDKFDKDVPPIGNEDDDEEETSDDKGPDN